MKIEHVTKGIRASSKLALTIALGCALLAKPTDAAGSRVLNCEGFVDPYTAYPPLPSTDGVDVRAGGGVVIYMQRERALVDLDGCVYEIDRPLLFDGEAVEASTVLVVLLEPDASNRVFVTESGTWTETIETSGSFEFTLPPDREIGFELAGPAQPLPTAPKVIGRPKPPK